MSDKPSNLRSQAEAMLSENFSNINAEFAQKMWDDILQFINSNDYVTLEDFQKVLELLQDDEAYQYKEPESEIIADTKDDLDEGVLEIDELEHQLLPDEVELDKTSLEELREQLQALNKEIVVATDVAEACDNYLQEDILTLILQDVNQVVAEARSQALIDSLGGVSTQNSYYLDHMIAVAPHQVVKGTLKALYQHVGGMYQNLVYGSTIYPDEAGFAGAIKDVLADKDMIHGEEPWQVKFGPGMMGGGRTPTGGV
jgi:hypothetical protein